MDDKALFLQFWDKESAATRKVISRIPEGSDYRPDPKSRTAREIAWLIVREETVLADGLEKGTLEWQEVSAPASVNEVLAVYDTAACQCNEEAQGAHVCELGTQGAIHVSGAGGHERERFRQRLGFLLRHDSSSRTTVHVSAPDGLDRAADLRPER